MNTKHTPGPWVITGDDGLTCTVGAIGAPVAKVLCGNNFADARLIAAAPELLEFAQWVMHGWMGEGMPYPAQIAAAARRVIAKATETTKE